MKLRFSPRKLFPLLLLITCSVSCVEDGYDLNDLETKPLTAGDRWSLPLGRGVVAASEILDVDTVDEIRADANGDYIVSYSDTISVLPDELPSIKQQSFTLPAVSIPSDLPAGSSMGFNINRELDIKGNDQVIELYWGDMYTGPDKSLVTIEMNLEGATYPGGRCLITAVLPEGYIIDRNYYAEATDDRTIKWDVSLSGTRLTGPLSP